MVTARVQALREKVNSRLAGAGEAKAENIRLKKKYEELKEELKDILELKQETLASLAGGFKEENLRLKKEISSKEEEIQNEIKAIEALIQEEPNGKAVPAVPVPPQNGKAVPAVPVPPKNGKAVPAVPVPPQDGAGRWFSLEEGDDVISYSEKKGRYVLEDEDMPQDAWPPVQFWGPFAGVVSDPDEATHYRVGR